MLIHVVPTENMCILVQTKLTIDLNKATVSKTLQIWEVMRNYATSLQTPMLGARWGFVYMLMLSSSDD